MGSEESRHEFTLLMEAKASLEDELTVLKHENIALKTKMSQLQKESGDTFLKSENERLQKQVAVLQNRLMRAQEVSLVSASVIDR